MGERAKDKGLPRRRARRCMLLAAGVAIGVLAEGGCHARAQIAELLDPYPSAGAGGASVFSQSGGTSSDTPSRFRRVLSGGNAPPSGAGSTGFVSTSPPDSRLLQEPVPVLGAAPADTAVASGTGGTGDVIVAVPPRPRRRPVGTEDPYEPLGLRLGSFVVKPAIEISGGFDSNPERDDRPSGSAVFIVAPELQVRSNWSRHELRADIRGRYKTYPGFDAVPSLDQPFVDSKLAARIDVTRRTRIELEGRFELSTEDPNSPDLPADLARLPVTMTGGVTAGLVQRFNRLEIGVSGSFDRTTYNDSVLTNGATVSNDDRNYNKYGAKLRGSYETLPGVRPFVEFATDRRIHDLPVDSFGLRRDSIGNEIKVGTTFDLARRFTGSVSVGYATRHYADPTLRNLDGLIADGSLVWLASPLTKVALTAQSQIAETTLTGVSGILRRDFGVQVDHSFRHWLIATVKFEYGIDDYVGSVREDQRYALSAMLTYKLSRRVQLKGEVRRQWLTSNDAGAAYTADIFLLGLRLQR